MTNYAYDALNRVTAVNYPAASGENVSYGYDAGANCTSGTGRLCQVSDESGATQYAYDNFGNVVSQIRTELGTTYLTQYLYDAGNRVTRVTYPDGRIVNVGRDSLGRTASVASSVNGTGTAIATRGRKPRGRPST